MDCEYMWCTDEAVYRGVCEYHRPARENRRSINFEDGRTWMQFSAVRLPVTGQHYDRTHAIFTVTQDDIQRVQRIADGKEEPMAQETIRVKVVAGRLMPVPKGERGWLFECSVHEGSIINYGNRRYLWTGGQLVDQTEEVRGE